jgi:hypothetical protein
MTERDTDIEFDFFEDFEPREPPEPEGPRPRRPGGPPRRPSSGPAGLTPLLRLAGLIAFAILIIVLLVFWAQSCQGSSKRSKYQSYMKKVGDIGFLSEQLGRQLTDRLTQPGIKPADLAKDILGIAQTQQQDVARAAALKSPGPLRSEQANMVEALQFRVGGLEGLATALTQATATKGTATAGAALAAQAQRLVTSDVVWDDLVRAPAVKELDRQGIGGVTVPDSNFVQTTDTRYRSTDFGSPRYWIPIVQRLSGAATGSTTSGLHGTGLVSVIALPSGKQLDPKTENTVTATSDLRFEVKVEDTGEAQEVQVKVTLTIQQQPTPIVKTQVIDSINPGEQKTVTFRNLGQVQFATKTVLKVDVQPVPGERNTSNNSTEYPVIFSLG